jgi:hypothetical protein
MVAVPGWSPGRPPTCAGVLPIATFFSSREPLSPRSGPIPRGLLAARLHRRQRPARRHERTSQFVFIFTAATRGSPREILDALDDASLVVAGRNADSWTRDQGDRRASTHRVPTDNTSGAGTRPSPFGVLV